MSSKADIAVVDDDLSVRKALTRLMRAAGYQATAFESAEEFLASRESERSDCLILDVHLPGMTGLELHANMVQARSKVPVIFISAFSDEIAHSDAIQSGAIEFLPKPLDNDRLLDAIEKALESCNE